MLEDECNVDVMKLEHDTPEDFEHCICQNEDDTNIFYVIFLRILNFYADGMTMWGIILVLLDRNEKCCIFFDFWALTIFTFTPLMQLRSIGEICGDFRTKYDVRYLDCMPWHYKFRWFFFNAALPANFLSPVIFWTQMYKNKSQVYHIVLNSVSPFLIFCDFLLLAFPLRILHVLHFTFFYVVYVLFTLIYQTSGGTGVNGSIPIYHLVDWRKPGKATLNSFFGLLIGVGFYFLFVFLNMGKLWLRDNYLCS